MSSVYAAEEEKERAAAISHATIVLFPIEHLAPWMSVLTAPKAHTLAGLKFIARVGEELDRRAWSDAHPGEKLPSNPEEREKWIKAHPDETLPLPDSEPESEWEWTKARGAVAMYGYGLRALAEEMHDIAPSIAGLGRRQASLIATANKTGLNASALEPPNRTLWERVRGKNKPSELAGMA